MSNNIKHETTANTNTETHNLVGNVRIEVGAAGGFLASAALTRSAGRGMEQEEWRSPTACASALQAFHNMLAEIPSGVRNAARNDALSAALRAMDLVLGGDGQI